MHNNHKNNNKSLGIINKRKCKKTHRKKEKKTIGNGTKKKKLKQIISRHTWACVL
jgi:hypothetical protein